MVRNVKIKIKVDKVKSVKRLSREENKIPNRGGPHIDKKEKRKSTKDYLEELEEQKMGIEQTEPKLTKAEVQWLRDKIGNMAQVIQSNAEYVKNDQGIDPEGAMSDILLAVKQISDTLDSMWNSVE